MKFARALLDGTLRLCLVDDATETLRPLPAGITELQQVIGTPAITPGAPLPLSGVTLLAPIIPQRNIFCVGKNYREHAREFSASGFEAGAPQRISRLTITPPSSPNPPARSWGRMPWSTFIRP